MLFENKSLLFDIKSTNGSKIYAMVKGKEKRYQDSFQEIAQREKQSQRTKYCNRSYPHIFKYFLFFHKLIPFINKNEVFNPFTVSVPIPLTSHNCSIVLNLPASFRYSTIALALFSPIPGRIISSYHSALFKSIFNLLIPDRCLQLQFPEATNADLSNTWSLFRLKIAVMRKNAANDSLLENSKIFNGRCSSDITLVNIWNDKVFDKRYTEILVIYHLRSSKFLNFWIPQFLNCSWNLLPWTTSGCIVEFSPMDVNKLEHAEIQTENEKVWQTPRGESVFPWTGTRFQVVEWSYSRWTEKPFRSVKTHRL